MKGRLARLVVASSGGDEAFLLHCERVGNWERLLEEAFEQGVAGVLVERMAAAGFTLPRAARETAERRLARDRLWHRRLTEDLRRVLPAIEESGVTAVALKGPVLAERLYPEAALRASGDLDLLVRPADLARAREVLEQSGYRRRPGAPPDHAMIFDGAGGGVIDLHHRASAGFGTTLEAEDLLARAVLYRTESVGPARILSREDEFLYLAVHAARHRFQKLRWLYELRLFVERHPDLAWGTVGDRARALHVRRAVSLACGVLERRLRVRLPEPVTVRRWRDILRLRAAVALAALADVGPGGTWTKTYRVFWQLTYQALLGEGTVSRARFWCSSLGRSAGKLWKTMTR